MPAKYRQINPWLSVSEVINEGEPAEILIYDRIGKNPFDPEDQSGISATEFSEALNSIPAGKPILVRFNCPGGNLWDGLTMYSRLQGLGDRVTCQIDGIAASSASIVALGGSKVVMPKSAMMMIHDPLDGGIGNSRQLRAKADKLDQHKEAILAVYTGNSKLSKETASALMENETWLTGQRCLDYGLVDELTDDPAVQNSFDLSHFRNVPKANAVNPQTTAPQNVGAPKQEKLMDKNEMIALLKNWGVTVPENATDAQLVSLVKAGKPAPAVTPAAPVDAAELQRQMSETNARMENMRRVAVTNAVNALVTDCRVTAAEAPAAITRALKDETYLAELQARPQIIPGAAPVDSGLTVVAEDAREIFKGMSKHIVPEGPQNAAMSKEMHVARGNALSAIYHKERARINAVMNTAGAVNTIDASLKRVMILNEVIRDFATRVLPLRLFSTVFNNVPLQGTDTIAVPYYPLQAATSSDFSDGAGGDGSTGYIFGQDTATNKALITVNKRKYQPIDYSSREFRFQPWFDAVRLGKLNAEKLGVDILRDVLSVVTLANFGAAAKVNAAAAMTSDDVADMRAACNLASWPDMGRSLIVDSTVDAALMKDPSYKLALNLGTTSVIQQGQFPNLSGFEYAWIPNLPSNSQNLIGFAAFASGILAAFCPVDPAPGVRAQLVAYEVVTDPATGISLNYRHWGLAQADRDYEIIESCYGYQAGVSAAIKRITSQ